MKVDEFHVVMPGSSHRTNIMDDNRCVGNPCRIESAVRIYATFLEIVIALLMWCLGVEY